MSPALVPRTRSAGLLAEAYGGVRRTTERLAAPLTAEDMQVQSMPDASPIKWHLGHTTWFFEALVLPRGRDARPFRPEFGRLFNSYYESLGARHPRPERGVLSRPTLEEVLAYRAHVDERMAALLGGDLPPDRLPLVELGVNHEQQHQELILTDILHAFSRNPLQPAYRPSPSPGPAPGPAVAPALRWVDVEGGVRKIGAAGGGFAFDHERPRHRVFVEPFQLSARLVTNAEYAEFMADGGYHTPSLWLAEGWDRVRAEGWASPLYWDRADDRWTELTLAGRAPVDPAAPVVHVSLYEADAYARWAKARLPTESELETAATGRPVEGNFLDTGALRPLAARGDGALAQVFGDAWEWTSSAFAPYPGFRAEEGAVGEYNGKFMCSQYVLRGGSCCTPASHMRASYRNFFPPWARWQVTGIRLAREVGAR